jgi:hypothetical protein
MKYLGQHATFTHATYGVICWPWQLVSSQDVFYCLGHLNTIFKNNFMANEISKT